MTVSTKRLAKLRQSASAGRAVFKLIVLSGGTYPVRSGFGLGEELEPIRALLSTRSSRAYIAIDRAASEPELQFSTATPSDFKPPVRMGNSLETKLVDKFYPLPLGWTLSDKTRNILEKQSGYFWSCEPDLGFLQTQKSLSSADCVQLQIYHELNRSVRSAAIEAEIANALIEHAAERLSHEKLIECYQGTAAR